MRRRPRGLAGLGLLLLALGALLSLPRFATTSVRPLTVFLIDTSASTRVGVDTPERLTRTLADWFTRELVERSKNEPWASGELAVVAFSGRSRIALAPLPTDTALRAVRRQGFIRKLLDESPPGSELDAALGAVEALLTGRAAARIVLLGDGSYSGANPGPRLSALAERGVVLETAAPARKLPDLALTRLDMAPRFAAGAPVVAALEVAWTPADVGPLAGAGLPVHLEVTLTGPGGVRREPWPKGEELELSAESPRWTRALNLGPLEEGAWRLDLSVDPADPASILDGFAANDRLVREFTVGPAKRLWIAAAPESRARAESFFAAELPGLALSFVEPAELAELLGGARQEPVDLLVTWNLALADLPAALLSSRVRSGLGWVALGSWGFLANPVGIDPNLATLLPLVLDDEGRPARKVILCVDGSGSMAGAPFDAVRRAVFELVRATPPQDEVSLTFFTNDLGAEWRIRPASTGPLALSEDALGIEGDQLQQLLTAEVPGGDTLILGALDELSRRRRAFASVPALVILLSDGAENGLDLEEPELMMAAFDEARRLSASLAAARTELAVVSITVGERSVAQADAARNLLEALVPPGKELHEIGLAEAAQTGELGGLGDIFAREVAAGMLATGDFDTLLGSGPLAAALAPRGAHLKTLGRFRVTPGSQLLALAVPATGSAPDAASAESPLPLLAVKRIAGLPGSRGGRVALLGTEPNSRWAPEWTSAASLAPLLDWLAAQTESRGPRVRRIAGGLELEGAASRLSKEDPAGTTRLAASVELEYRTSTSTARVSLELAPGVGGEPTWRGSLPGNFPPTAAVELDFLNPDLDSGDALLATLWLAAEPEGQEGWPDRPRLGPLPRAAEGVVARAQAAGGPLGAHRGAPWVLLAALLALFAALLKRY